MKTPAFSPPPAQPVQQTSSYPPPEYKGKSNKKIFTALLVIIIVAVIVCVLVYFVFYQQDTVNETSDAMDSDIMASWDFNEGTGSIIQDKSGNGNTGYTFGTTWHNDPFRGQVLSFDGDLDFIDFKDFDVGNDITVSLWINPTLSSNKKCFIGKHSDGGDNLFLFGIWEYGYHVRIRDENNEVC